MVDLLVEAERQAVHLAQVAQRTRDLIAQSQQLLATQQLERDAAGGSVHGGGGKSGVVRGVGLGWPSDLTARVKLRGSHP